MIKVGLGLLAILLTAFLGAGIWFSKKSPTATINKQVFKIEVAGASKDKQIGLSKYSKINNDFAMLFPFEKPDYYSFWMKEVQFPIDIIFIKDNKIVTIYRNVQPSKNNLIIYKPKTPSNKVIEINAGLSQKYSFKEGNQIELKNI